MSHTEIITLKADPTVIGRFIQLSWGMDGRSYQSVDKDSLEDDKSWSTAKILQKDDRVELKFNNEPNSPIIGVKLVERIRIAE